MGKPLSAGDLRRQAHRAFERRTGASSQFGQRMASDLQARLDLALKTKPGGEIKKATGVDVKVLYKIAASGQALGHQISQIQSAMDTLGVQSPETKPEVQAV